MQRSLRVWWKRRVVIWPAILLLLYAGWCALLFAKQDGLIFLADMAGREDWPADTTYERTLTAQTEAGPVRARLLLPRVGLIDGRARAAALVFHGNADTAPRFVSAPEVQALLRHGVAVLIPEYRGYGHEPGEPSQRALVADALLFREELLRATGVAPARVVYAGRSLGTGVACDLATRQSPAGLLLISPFRSLSSMTWRFGVPPAVLKHPFRNDRALEGFGGPVLIVHGRADTVVPIAHGRALAQLTSRATLLEDDSDHNDTPQDRGALDDAVGAWLALCLRQ
jgi:pimeloyl-ACP methyl ester carboxylesterase